MLYNIIKVMISAIIIVLISVISKKSSLLGAILASVPLVSVLGIIWLYVDTGDIEQISQLSKDIFWLVIPSLSFFIILPILLNKGLSFYISISLSLTTMIIFYFLMIKILKYFGIHLQ